MRLIIIFLSLSIYSSLSAQVNSESTWQQNSFPSEKHKTEDYIEFGGEMRGQRVNYFGISPSNPNFMIMAGNMAGQGLVSTNGKDFKAFGTKAGWCGNTFGFSPFQ